MSLIGTIGGITDVEISELDGLFDVVITAPTDGQVLTYQSSNNTWINAATSGGTPGGSDTQLQRNNAGAFGGISGATSDGVTVTLTTPTLNGIVTGTGVDIAVSNSTLAQRDTNQNLVANNFVSRLIVSTATGGTTTMLATTHRERVVIGSNSQNYKLPNATLLPQVGVEYIFYNYATGALSIRDAGNNVLTSIPSGSAAIFTVSDISTSNGVWRFRFLIPENGVWSTAGLSVTGTLAATGHVTFEGVTSTGAVGSGALVFGTNPTLTGATIAGGTLLEMNGAEITVSSVTSIDPANRYLKDPSAGISYDWNRRLFKDSTGATTLIDHTGTSDPTVALSFDTATLGTFFPGIINNTGLGVNKRALIVDTNYNIAVSSVTSAELASLSGVSGTVVSAPGTDRKTAQTAATSLAAYTVGASDASFYVSANVLVTTATLHNFTVTCSYTDEGNTARTETMPFSVLAGTFITAITNASGAVPYTGIPIHIRCKAGTTITLATTGTFTTVIYNFEERILAL